jgi:predicted DNA binding CopG/RHH family protein
MKQKNDPFKNLVLDEEEKLLEEAFERGEYEVSSNFEETKQMLADAAKRYIELNKSKSVTIRLNQLDLIKLKARAKKKSIPYQTLLSALVNDYVEGRRELTI